MILVTVGSTHFPFPRMNRLVVQMIRHRPQEAVVFQYGSLLPDIHDPTVTLAAYLPQTTLLGHMKRARIIVAHGGPGTIYQALSFGTIPWVLPREKRYREHLTDHQVSFCRFMKHRGLVRIVTDNTPVDTILKKRIRTTPLRQNNTALIRYLDTLLPAV